MRGGPPEKTNMLQYYAADMRHGVRWLLYHMLALHVLGTRTASFCVTRQHVFCKMSAGPLTAGACGFH